MFRTLCRVALLVAGSLVLQACYVSQDEQGQWWACEEYATPGGPATACAPMQPPF